MRTRIIEQRIPIGVPDAHGICFSADVFEHELHDDPATVPRVIGNHDESTAPFGKVTRISTRVETVGTTDVGVIRQEIELGEIADYGDFVAMEFSGDHRPFLCLTSNSDVAVDPANLGQRQFDDFVAQTHEIFPEATVGCRGRKSFEPEVVLWLTGGVGLFAIQAWLIAKAIAEGADAARKLPIIGPLLQDVEEGIREVIDAKGKIHSLVAKFKEATGKSNVQVNTTVPIGACTVVLLADSEDAAEALGEAHAVRSANADLLTDASEVLFIYRDGRWVYQYKALNSGDVQMTRECFERTMSVLTDTGALIYPEQLKYIKLARHLDVHQNAEGKWETQVNLRSPSGNLLSARAAIAENTDSGLLLTFRNKEQILVPRVQCVEETNEYEEANHHNLQ